MGFTALCCGFRLLAWALQLAVGGSRQALLPADLRGACGPLVGHGARMRMHAAVGYQPHQWPISRNEADRTNQSSEIENARDSIPTALAIVI